MNINSLKNPGTRVILTLLESQGKEGLKKVQEALNAMGKDVYVDGIVGPITIRIIKSVDNSLLHKEIENIILGKTIKTTGSTSWMELAKAELGTKEVQGSGNNPRVLQYHAVSGGFTEDSVPWCASFINFIMIKDGYKGPKYPARAKSWLNFGKSSVNPVYGSIAVKSRKGGGHVCFVVGEDITGNYVYCLGGNQGDEVNIRKYSKKVFLDYRVPNDYDLSKAKLEKYGGQAKRAGKES